MLINIRKLVALDLTFHGVVFILVEFTVTLLLCGTLAVVSLAYFLRTQAHPLSAGVLGCILLLIAINYIPLLLYAIGFMKHKNAQTVIAAELADKARSAKKYTVQSLLLLVPLVVPILAVLQERQLRGKK